MKAKKREVALRSGALVHKLGEHRYGELSSESEAYEAALQCIDRALTVCVLASVSEGQPLRGASLTNAMNSVELELVDAIELIRAAWDPYKTARGTREQWEQQALSEQSAN